MIMAVQKFRAEFIGAEGRYAGDFEYDDGDLYETVAFIDFPILNLFTKKILRHCNCQEWINDYEEHLINESFSHGTEKLRIYNRDFHTGMPYMSKGNPALNNSVASLKIENTVLRANHLSAKEYGGSVAHDDGIRELVKRNADWLRDDIKIQPTFNPSDKDKKKK